MIKISQNLDTAGIIRQEPEPADLGYNLKERRIEHGPKVYRRWGN
jgi:hypothetical protein